MILKNLEYLNHDVLGVTFGMKDVYKDDLQANMKLGKPLFDVAKQKDVDFPTGEVNQNGKAIFIKQNVAIQFKNFKKKDEMYFLDGPVRFKVTNLKTKESRTGRFGVYYQKGFNMDEMHKMMNDKIIYKHSRVGDKEFDHIYYLNDQPGPLTKQKESEGEKEQKEITHKDLFDPKNNQPIAGTNPTEGIDTDYRVVKRSFQLKDLARQISTDIPTLDFSQESKEDMLRKILQGEKVVTKFTNQVTGEQEDISLVLNKKAAISYYDKKGEEIRINVKEATLTNIGQQFAKAEDIKNENRPAGTTQRA
ncbi:hypothetical protein SAMN05421788_110191 [Filimonas lacunae]|uniref:Uncharacterized protein n=1 Tax=Filimonas lacunae TaxID=477680 RepID=A0A173MA90_9BACT|nr:hypothetical protein [Filimonas lacunae]BAV04457.1 hypothetical protein FLA_0448 [Filimonas lacunae]SIT31482.1 hypothetical protein SAMN05421788_110191 [Filimonas lacunae]